MSLDHNSEFPSSLCLPRSYKNCVLVYSQHFYCTVSRFLEGRAMQWRKAFAAHELRSCEFYTITAKGGLNNSLKKAPFIEQAHAIRLDMVLNSIFNLQRNVVFIRASDATRDPTEVLPNSLDLKTQWTDPSYCQVTLNFLHQTKSLLRNFVLLC